MEVYHEELNSEQLDYIDSFIEPVEFDFLSESQRKAFELEASKLNKSLKHFKAVFGDTSWTENIDKDILKGDVFSIQQALNISDKIKAQNWYGSRRDIDKSLVSPTGQRVIMSKKCSDDLDLNMDGYVDKNSFSQLMTVLTEEGVDRESVKKIQAAMDTHGVIVMQNGIFTALRSMVEDFLTRKNIRNESIPSRMEQISPIVSEPKFSPPIKTPAPSLEPAKEMTPFEKKLAQASAPASHGVDLEVLKHRMEGSAIKTAPAKMNLNNPVNSEIKREVSTAELPAHLEPKPAMPKPYVPPARPVPPAPRPAPVSAPKPPPPPAIRPVIQTPPLGAMPLAALNKIKSVDDLKKIEPGHLRQGPIQAQIDLIKTTVLSLAKSNRIMPYYAVLAFEQSPLFKTYLQIGALMMNDVGVDRVTAFKDASKQLGNNLTLDEFESVADLRKSLEQL